MKRKIVKVIKVISVVLGIVKDCVRHIVQEKKRAIELEKHSYSKEI